MSSQTSPQTREVIIRPNQSWLHIDWQGIVQYRDLLWLLVRRDFVSKYKQTLLGPAWFIVNPLINSVVFTIIFGRIVGIPTDGIPPMLFYLCGQLGWTYFANVLNATSASFTGNAHLFSKVYFPRLIPPLAATISSLLALAIQFATFLGFYIYFAQFTQVGAHLSLNTNLLPVLPLLVLHMALLGLGVGLLLSSFTAKYRDFHHMSGFLVQLWMYATPVIYPLSQIPENWRWIAVLNPMTSIVEATRLTFLGVGTVTPYQYACSLAISALICAAGMLIYQRTSRSFVDSV